MIKWLIFLLSFNIASVNEEHQYYQLERELVICNTNPMESQHCTDIQTQHFSSKRTDTATSKMSLSSRIAKYILTHPKISFTIILTVAFILDIIFISICTDYAGDEAFGTNLRIFGSWATSGNTSYKKHYLASKAKSSTELTSITDQFNSNLRWIEALGGCVFTLLNQTCLNDNSTLMQTVGKFANDALTKNKILETSALVCEGRVFHNTIHTVVCTETAAQLLPPGCNKTTENLKFIWRIIMQFNGTNIVAQQKPTTITEELTPTLALPITATNEQTVSPSSSNSDTKSIEGNTQSTQFTESKTLLQSDSDTFTITETQTHELCRTWEILNQTAFSATNTNLIWQLIIPNGEPNSPSAKDNTIVHVINDTLWLWNGDIWQYNFTEWKNIITPGQKPTPRSLPLTALEGDIIWLYAGGAWPDGPYKDLWKYYTNNNTWQKLPDLAGHAQGGSTLLDGIFYAFGGLTDFSDEKTKVNTFSQFSNGVWSQLPTQPDARWGAKLITINGIIYLFGGCAKNIPLMVFNDLWSYDPSSQIWQQIQVNSILPPPRAFATIGNLEGDIIIFGGYGVEPALNDFWRYNIINKEWTLLNDGKKDAPSPRTVNNFGQIGDIYYLFGGGLLNDLWQFGMYSIQVIKFEITPAKFCDNETVTLSWIINTQSSNMQYQIITEIGNRTFIQNYTQTATSMKLIFPEIGIDDTQMNITFQHLTDGNLSSSAIVSLHKH